MNRSKCIRCGLPADDSCGIVVCTDPDDPQGEQTVTFCYGCDNQILLDWYSGHFNPITKKVWL